jgi:hypothetical protein
MHQLKMKILLLKSYARPFGFEQLRYRVEDSQWFSVDVNPALCDMLYKCRVYCRGLGYFHLVNSDSQDVESVGTVV